MFAQIIFNPRLNIRVDALFCLSRFPFLWLVQTVYLPPYACFFIGLRILSSPDILLKSCLEHISAAWVAFFSRAALTQAGSYLSKNKNKAYSSFPHSGTVDNFLSIVSSIKRISTYHTSGTIRENPNLMNKSMCSIMRMAARPGDIFHSPSWSYKHTRRMEFVQIDITIRNWNWRYGPELQKRGV